MRVELSLWSEVDAAKDTRTPWASYLELGETSWAYEDSKLVAVAAAIFVARDWMESNVGLQ